MESFDQEPSIQQTPTGIRTLTIVLQDTIGEIPSAKFKVLIEDQFGEIMSERRSNLKPYLTSGQINSLQTFLEDMRTKAELEILS